MKKLALIIGIALTCAFSSAFAQSSGQKPAQKPQMEITAKDKKAFSKVMPKIQNLNQEAVSKLKNTKEPKKAQMIKGKYQKKMITEIRSSGLTIRKFNYLAQNQ